MELRRDISLFDNQELISAIYVKDEFKATDMATEIYDRYKISILLSDGLNAVVGNSVIIGEKNSIMFFRPDELHFGQFTNAGTHSYLNFFIPVTFFDKFCNNKEIISFLTDKSDNRVNYIMFDIPYKKNISEIASNTIDLLESDVKNSDMKIFSLMFQIILLCSDFYEKQKSNPIANQMPGIIKKTIMYILDNFNNKLSLKELASEANCSVTYLSRIFKKYVGITIYNYITATRISNAQIMLKENASVTETCFASGFDDCSNFIRTFKKATGETPLQFQKNFAL